jgi:hypothetical protein
VLDLALGEADGVREFLEGDFFLTHLGSFLTKRKLIIFSTGQRVISGRLRQRQILLQQ